MGVVRGDNSLYFGTGLDNSGLLKGSADAVGIVQNMATKIAKINPFSAIAVGAIASFSIIASKAYDLVKDFNHAMSEVSTISEATKRDFKGISSAVFELSNISPDKPADLAKAYYEIVSAGYDGAKGLKVLEVSAKSAVAGVTDTKTAADGLTTVLNAFSIDASKSEQVADALFNTVKLGKTNFSQLATNIAQVAPIAASSNISLNEVLATVASLTKQGTPTSVAMTQIRAAIVGLQKAGKLDGTKTLQENMQAMYNSFKGNQTEIQKQVGSIEALQAILAVSGAKAKGVTKDLESYSSTLGAMNTAYAEMMKSNTNQWAVLKNQAESVLKDLGQDVYEVSNKFAGFLNRVLDVNDGMSRQEKLITQERDGLNTLVNTILLTNEKEEIRKKLLDDLNAKYPDFLGNINLEKVSNEQLVSSLQSVNALYFEKIKLAGMASEQAEKEVKLQELYRKEREQTVKIAKAVEEFNSNKKEKVQFDNEEDAVKYLDENTQTRGADKTPFKTNYLDPLNKTKEEIKKLQKEIEKGIKKVADKNKEVAEKELQEKKKRIEAEKQAVKELYATKRKEAKNNSALIRQYNKEEAEAIKEIEAKLSTKKTTTPITPTTPKGDGKSDTSFKDVLKAKEKAYKDYALAIKNGDLELAKSIKENNNLKAEDYRQYLIELYNNTKDYNKKIELLNEGEANGIFKPRKKVQPLDLKPMPININLKADTTSYNAISNKIKALEEMAKKSQDENEQKSLGILIQAEKKKLKVVEERLNGTKDKEEDFYKTIQSLSRKGLINKKRELKKELKSINKNTEEGAKAYEKAQDKIRKINEKIGKDIAGVAQEFSTAFSGLSDIFSKFGNDEMAGLMGQLGGVASGIGQIASGDIIGGAMSVLSSALTVEVVSDTAKFEKAIGRLEKAIEKMDYAISKSFGKDEGTKRIDAIAQQKELENNLKKAEEAERNARKQVKFLGLKIGKKGKGSGTDPKKIEEFKEKAEQARRKVAELKDELKELMTGANRSTFMDKFLSDLKDGKTSVDEMKESFGDMMRNALMNSFKNQVLKGLSKRFFDEFAELSDNDGKADGISDLTPSEIKRLGQLQKSLSQQALNSFEVYKKIAKEGGIEGGLLGEVNKPDKKGLAGAITTVTEDTANILAGTVNSIMTDVAESVKIAQNNLIYLQQIAHNTSYNRHLESMNIRLQNIETLLS
ncbi:MAG: phage tail tape measure protein [Tenacibaculum sp.]|nr:phage tail tape measure protein [Tenacibaculum sp.]